MSVLQISRWSIGIGGLCLIWLAELVWPYRPLVDRRWRRYTINVFILGSNALVLTALLGGMIVAAYHAFELSRFGLLTRLGIGSWWNIGLTMLMLDAVTYGWHRAYHGLPLMWRMHRVHHSDRDLDVTTSGRFHFLEMALSAVFRLGVIALWGPTVAAVLVFEIIFGLLNQLEHANLQLPARLDAALRLAFVTPAMHRVHHSQVPADTNSNYSTIFSWWDRLCGTYRAPGAEQRTLTIGLPEYAASADVTFGKVLAMPFGLSCEAARQRPAPSLA